jgi:hypothetical protein
MAADKIAASTIMRGLFIRILPENGAPTSCAVKQPLAYGNVVATICTCCHGAAVTPLKMD